MRLYTVQKPIHQLNRDRRVRERFEADLESVLRAYELTDEEPEAVRRPDIGLPFVLGVNGQPLMHYAAMHGYRRADYIRSVRDGIGEHGRVRRGLYAMLEE